MACVQVTVAMDRMVSLRAMERSVGAATAGAAESVVSAVSWTAAVSWRPVSTGLPTVAGLQAASVRSRDAIRGTSGRLALATA